MSRINPKSADNPASPRIRAIANPEKTNVGIVSLKILLSSALFSLMSLDTWFVRVFLLCRQIKS